MSLYFDHDQRVLRNRGEEEDERPGAGGSHETTSLQMLQQGKQHRERVIHQEGTMFLGPLKRAKDLKPNTPVVKVLRDCLQGEGLRVHTKAEGREEMVWYR